MKGSIVAAVFGLIGLGNAHYVFDTLILNDTRTKPWEYVRQTGPLQGPDDQVVQPVLNSDSHDTVCGRNATGTGYLAKTATVRAGDRVGFAVGQQQWPGYPGFQRMWHYGPLSVWLSRPANGNLETYKGDGQWFKILSVTGRTEQSVVAPAEQREYAKYWGSYWADSWNFTIPTTTPPGKYLLRIEQFMPETNFMTQFYISCAHIEVLNTGKVGKNPGPMVKIPGVYFRGQSDVYFDAAYDEFDITKYKAPAPKVWDGN